MRSDLQSPEVFSTGPLDAMETFFERGWTDGLPIVPPTPERVEAFLSAAGLEPDEVLGDVPTREVVVTAEKAAINAVMAGCRPEYMPVVVAACRAALEERFNLHANSGTLSGAAQVIVVNGPVRKALEINGAAGVFGPGFRANATIGRALRLMIRNVARSVPGAFDRASFSQPGRYSWCYGENEEDHPWTPLHVERGYPPDASTVTVFAVMDPVKVTSDAQTPERIFDEAAFRVRTVWTHTVPSSFDATRSILVVIGPEHAKVCEREGWAKEEIRAFLFGRLTSPGRGREVASPLYDPENILLTAAGGPGMQQSWFMVPFPSHGPVTRVIDPAERPGGRLG